MTAPTNRARPRGRSNNKPEVRLNLVAALVVTSLALATYVLALVANLSPPPNFAILLLTIAPTCAIPAAVLLAVRARAEQDDALRAVTAGLVIGCVGMALSVMGSRLISPGGGVFATTTTGATLLVLLWHLALPAGALASTLGRPRRTRRRIGMAVGVGLAFYFAVWMSDSWRVIHRDGTYFISYTLSLVGVVAFTAAAIFRWVRRDGLRPTVTRGWITVAMLLSIYDLTFNALGHQRFSEIWWASMGIRAATYAVLLGGLIVGTAKQLHRLERYATTELARAEGEVSSWAEVTERLLATTSALSAAVTAEDVAVLLTAAAAGATDADDAVVYLREDVSPDRLRVMGSLRGRELSLGVSASAGTPYTDVLTTRSPLFLQNPAEINRAFPSGAGLPPANQIRSLVALPLVVGDVAFGSLLLTSSAAREYRPLERELLSALVRVGAQALQRALLYEQQSSVATTLQQALLPQSLPARTDVELVGRYLPATAGVDVGGDWYDVLELSESRLLLVVGDVMGKGVPAATLMGQLRSAVRTLAAVDPDPAAILSGLDQLATGFALDDIVTLVIVALDTAARSAVIANAGHLPPLVLTPGGTQDPGTALGSPSPPIGVPVTGPRASVSMQLTPGATLLLLTDGLVEDRADDLDVRLASLTSSASNLLSEPGADLEAVTDALVNPRVHRDDDVTVLLARLPAAGSVAAAPSARDAGDRSCWLDVDLPQEPGAVSHARGLVRDAASTRLPSIPGETLDAVLLVTSELVTNSLRHGEPPVHLMVEGLGRRLRVTVNDWGSSPPRPRFAGPDATSGRGLFLVSALATEWKIEPHSSSGDAAGAGTSVWAEFAI